MSAKKTSLWPPFTDDEYRDQAIQAVGEELVARLETVQILVLDCDGVLTSGNLIYGPRGEAFKEFNSHDGLGLVMARMAGLKRAVLTGRNSAIVQRRCQELRFDSIKLGRFDKAAALQEIFSETGCAADGALYMGDDLIDLPAMMASSLAVCVPGSPAELRGYCDHETSAAGGHGAVREVTDLVLKSSRKYSLALNRLLEKSWQPTKGELSSDEELTQ